MTKKQKLIQDCVARYVRNVEFATNEPISNFVKSKREAVYSDYRIKDLESALIYMDAEYERERKRRKEKEYWSTKQGQKNLADIIKSINEFETKKSALINEIISMINDAIAVLTEMKFETHFVYNSYEILKLNPYGTIYGVSPYISLRYDELSDTICMEVQNKGPFDIISANDHADCYILISKLIEYFRSNPDDILSRVKETREYDNMIRECKDNIKNA